MMEITVALKPGVGWWYRVHMSPSQDWSGVADSMYDAWAKAHALAARLLA